MTLLMGTAQSLAAVIRRAAPLALAVALGAPGGAQGAPPTADLTVTSVKAKSEWAVAGSALRVTDTVTNSGRAKARASQTGYWLSRDRKQGRGDIRLAGKRRVKALAPRKRSKGTARLRVPATLKLDAYHLLACADANRRVRERNERNNCRAAKQKVAITPRPRPYAVRAVPDAARAVAQTVGPDGATLVATAGDGTRFTLTIPQGALLSDERISMAPLARIEGFPLSRGMAGGVQLGPDGLALLRPAKLAIEPAAHVAPARRTGFAYHGTGREFHLVPIRSEGAAHTLAVRHFSGYGSGDADAAERSRFAKRHPPTDPADQAAQQHAAPAREREIDAMALAGHAHILSLIRDRETLEQGILMLGVYEAMSPRLAPRFATLRSEIAHWIRRHVADARSRCFTYRDLREAAWMLRIANLAQLHAPDAIGDVAAALERCVRFEFGMDMAARDNVGGGSTTYAIAARVQRLPVTLVSGFAPGSLMGHQTLQVMSYDVADSGCWKYSWNVRPVSPFEVRGVHFLDLNLRWAVPQPAPPPRVAAVDVDIGSILDEVTETWACPGEEESTFDLVQGVYDDGLGHILAEGGGSPTQITGWTGSGPAFEARVSADGGWGSYTGSARFTLTHAPQP
jgi:hypothetical protein